MVGIGKSEPTVIILHDIEQREMSWSTSYPEPSLVFQGVVGLS